MVGELPQARSFCGDYNDRAISEQVGRASCAWLRVLLMPHCAQLVLLKLWSRIPAVRIVQHAHTAAAGSAQADAAGSFGVCARVRQSEVVLRCSCGSYFVVGSDERCSCRWELLPAYFAFSLICCMQVRVQKDAHVRDMKAVIEGMRPGLWVGGKYRRGIRVRGRRLKPYTQWAERLLRYQLLPMNWC